MRNHADFFRPHLKAAFGIEPVGTAKVSEWLSSSSASLAPPSAPKYPQSFNSLQALRPMFTFEAATFASAALESFSTVRSRWSEPLDRDGIAWKLITLYYAAYYSAHSLLRLCGVSVTQVDDWRRVESDFALLYSSNAIPALGLEKGYHVITLDLSGQSISVSKARVDSKSGSHTAVWREFRDLADLSYANNALNTSGHQAAISAYSQGVASPLIVDGTQINWPWMPVIRNRVNYRLPELIWGTDSKRISAALCQKIHRLIISPTQSLVEEAATERSEWVRFAASCVYMIGLLCHLIRDMEIRSSRRNFLPRLITLRSALIGRLCSA